MPCWKLRRFSARVLSSYSRGYYRLSLSPPRYKDTLQGGCINTLPLRDRTTHLYPPKSGTTIWHRPPPERGYPPGRGGAKKAYTFFQPYSERCQNLFWLKIFLYIFFEIYFPAASQPTCLKIIFLRCVRARISWHDMMHKVPEDCLAYHHHHLALK